MRERDLERAGTRESRIERESRIRVGWMFVGRGGDEEKQGAEKGDFKRKVKIEERKIINFSSAN